MGYQLNCSNFRRLQIFLYKYNCFSEQEQFGACVWGPLVVLIAVCMPEWNPMDDESNLNWKFKIFLCLRWCLISRNFRSFDQPGYLHLRQLYITRETIWVPSCHINLFFSVLYRDNILLPFYLKSPSSAWIRLPFLFPNNSHIKYIITFPSTYFSSEKLA